MTCGIYAILNIVDQKTYIGKSKNIEQRWYTHKSQLRHFTHDNKGLREDWARLGESAFCFVILEEADLKDIDVLEMEYIRRYREENLYNYNIENHPWKKLGYFLAQESTGKSSAIEKIKDCDGDLLPLRYCPNCNLHKLANSFRNNLYCFECFTNIEAELLEEIETIESISILTGISSAPEGKPVSKYKLSID